MRFCCALALITGLAASAVRAEPPPSPAQLARAKRAFADGKKLHDAGKLTEAIEKFKASYELSRSPLLLYNIALSLDELGADNRDLAVVFYRRFLAEAPSDAAHRQDASERITAITQALAPPTPPTPAPAPHVPTAADVVHQAVDAAPPDAPVDIAATVPEAAPFSATLFFRGADEPGFASTPMLRRGGELVGRIPAVRMTGPALHYYLEVRDASGTVITRIGKPTSPNIIHIDAAAPGHAYPDVGEPLITPPPPLAPSGDREDPIARAAPPAPRVAGERALRPIDVARWGTTGLAGVGVGLGITFYVLAHGHATALENDTTACGSPPCQRYDDFDRNLQRTGKLEQTLSRVALVTGAVSAVAAGYLWFRALSHADEPKPATGVTIAPTLGSDGRPGVVAAGRF